MARKESPRTASGELFPTDSPLPAGQLIGRRDDVAEVATRLEAGTHLVGVDAIAVNVNPSRHGLRAGLHLTREQARDLHAVLGEVLS